LGLTQLLVPHFCKRRSANSLFGAKNGDKCALGVGRRAWLID
jgi:hypothetical protein